MKNTRLFHTVLVTLAVVALVVTACGPAATTVAPTTAPVATAVPAKPTTVPPTAVPPTAEPTAVPLGSAEHPIIMALAPSATTQELLASGESIAKQLSEETGLTIKTVVPTSYGALIEAMGSNNAQIGWLPPFAYIVAHQKGVADVGLITVRNGSDFYSAQFIANAEAGFTSAKDSKDVAALKQFEGKKPCWTDPLSASGYVIPLGILKNEGIKNPAGAWVQGHSTVVKSVYLSPKGEICAFGATFSDARSGIATDFPDVNDKVQIIYTTDPVIPNDNVSYAPDLPADLRAKITAGLLKISETEDGKQALQAVYQISGLKATEDSFYDNFRVFLEASGVDVSNIR